MWKISKVSDHGKKVLFAILHEEKKNLFYWFWKRKNLKTRLHCEIVNTVNNGTGFPSYWVLGFLYIYYKGQVLYWNYLEATYLQTEWKRLFQNGCQISVLNGLYIGVCVADLHDPKIKQELGKEPYIDIPSFVAWFVWDRKFNCHSYSTNYCGAYIGQFHVVILFWLCMLTNNGICFSFLIIPTCPYKHFICIITLPVILISGKYWFGQPLIC